MTTSHLPPTLGAATSAYKIQVNSSTIYIGDQEFLSATDALELYLTQYDSHTRTRSGSPTRGSPTRGGLQTSGTGRYARTVGDLLNPKSALHMTAERSLETGVRDTEMELKIADAKDSISESLLHMKKTVNLQAQAKKKYYRHQRERVEDALNKSKELMDQINTDDVAPATTDCPSDVGSLATDILVSMNPAEGYRPAPAWKSKHVYGYKRPSRARRHKTMSSLQISHDMMGLTEDKPNTSFTGQPQDKSPHVTFNDEDTSPAKHKPTSYDDDVSLLLGDSPDTSRLSRSPNKKAHERSRSVSPSILKRERKMFESGLRDKPIPDFYTELTIPPKPPSWIDTLNLSDVSDSDWKKRDFTTSRPPPSWIQDIDNSDITSVVSTGKSSKPLKKLQLHDLLRPLPVINTQDSSYNSDANDTLPPSGLTFKDLIGDASNLKNTQNKNTDSPLSPSLSEKLNDLKKKTTSALNKYHDRVPGDTPSKGDMPRCSSMDAAALVAGIPSLGKSDITGASPIVPGGSSAPGSPAKRKGRPASPDTDIVLDGDRPWEKTAPFKPPVSVQDTSRNTTNGGPNYSGGSQPGSLEALKNMIFKLQQEAITTDSEDEGSRSKISERVHKLRAEAANLGISYPPGDGNETERKARPGQAPGDIPALKGYDFKGEPGGQSLEKALTHLDKLKNLVSEQQTTKAHGRTTNVKPLCADMDL